MSSSRKWRAIWPRRAASRALADAPAEPGTRRLCLRGLLAGALHLVYPTPCHICGRPLDFGRVSALCSACWAALERVPLQGCARCGWPFPGSGGSRGAEQPLCQRCRETRDAFQIARAALCYREDGIARGAILLCKHGGRLRLLRHLAALLAEEAPGRLVLSEWDAVVPVPLHWTRRLRRGFNQAEILALAVGGGHGLPVLRWALRRVRRTAVQHGDPAERRANVRGAFAVSRPWQVAGKRILLVDDVFTTGATVNACAHVLLEAGAAAVGVLTLARVE